MAVPFPSEEWIKALAEALNQSRTYAEAAKHWEGDFYFVVEPEGSLQEKVFLYLDLWHGKCREACVVSDENEKTPEFRMWGPVTIWKRIIEGQLDPMQALLTRQLKLKGNMTKIMRSVKAAQELVKCCTCIDTEFPI